MEIQLTAVFRESPEGYVALSEELPGANSQGASLGKAKENLREAVVLVLRANRTLNQEEPADAEVFRAPLDLSACVTGIP